MSSPPFESRSGLPKWMNHFVGSGQRAQQSEEREERRDRQVGHADGLAEALRPADERVYLLGADDGDRDDGNVVLHGETCETRAERAELVALAEGLRHAGYPLGEEQDRLAHPQQRLRVLPRRRDAAHLAIERVQRRDRLDEPVVEKAHDPLAQAVDGGDDHGAVERKRTRVVRDQQHGARRRHVLRATDLDAPVAIVEKAERRSHALAQLQVEAEGITRLVGGAVCDLEGGRRCRFTHADASAAHSGPPTRL